MSKKDEWFQTSCGLRVYPGAWGKSDKGWLDIGVIASALAKVNRFGGHTFQPYSVAQHSTWVYRQAFNMPWRFQAQALLHDATEAYANDMVRAVKSQLPDYKELEKKLWRRIADHYGVPRKLHPAIKFWDNLACAIERRSLQNAVVSPLEQLPGIARAMSAYSDVKPVPCWENACRLFLDAANTLKLT